MANRLTIEKYRTIRALYDNLVNYVGILDDKKILFTPEGDCSDEKIVERLCSSLQNSGQMRNSIRFNVEGDKCNRDKIEEALFGYKAEKFIIKYHRWQDLYAELINLGIKDNGKKRKGGTNDQTKMTNWEKYARGLYQGIHYLKDNNDRGFKTVKSMIELSNDIQSVTDKEIDTIIDITAEISGMGIALVCDWLKECGCTWLVKPDTHICEVYKCLIGAQEEKVTEEKIIVDMFEYASLIKKEYDESMTAYKLDKMIWLICTGDFYQYDIKVGRDLLMKRLK